MKETLYDILHIPKDANTEQAEILYFVGCTAALTPDIEEVAVNTAKILKKLGIDFSVFGEHEVCCGSVAMRTGDRKAFNTVATKNYEMFKKSGVKSIITSCAGCYRTLKKDYADYMEELGIIVYHTIEFLNKHINENNVQLKNLGLNTTYHDPCHTGRHLGLYEEPREILKNIAKLTEMRLGKVKKLLAETQDEVEGLDNLGKFFAKCINCHNCMRVCPVDYCQSCYFESVDLKYVPEYFFQMSKNTGSIHFPTDILLYHMGRMIHMTMSCVGCGTCEDACPMSIPVAQVYSSVADEVQELFEYLSGRDSTEPRPAGQCHYPPCRTAEGGRALREVPFLKEGICHPHRRHLDFDCYLRLLASGLQACGNCIHLSPLGLSERSLHLRLHENLVRRASRIGLPLDLRVRARPHQISLELHRQALLLGRDAAPGRVSDDAEPAPQDGRRRKYHEITAAGLCFKGG